MARVQGTEGSRPWALPPAGLGLWERWVGAEGDWFLWEQQVATLAPSSGSGWLWSLKSRVELVESERGRVTVGF